MAGDWSKIEHCTPDKPEIMRIAALLNCSIGDAFLGCFKVWRWADQQSYEGNAPGVTSALLDAHVGVTGFAQAMATVGWLTVTPDGVSIPEFNRHTSESAKKRALAAKRSASHRSKSNAKSNAPGVTSASPREEKRREEKREDAGASSSPLPPAGGGRAFPPPLDTPEFRRTWERWEQHRKEKKQKLTPTSVELQLKKLSGFGLATAIESVEQSIANGWTGIFEVSAKGGKSGTGKPSPGARFDPSVDYYGDGAAEPDAGGEGKDES